MYLSLPVSRVMHTSHWSSIWQKSVLGFTSSKRSPNWSARREVEKGFRGISDPPKLNSPRKVIGHSELLAGRSRHKSK